MNQGFAGKSKPLGPYGFSNENGNHFIPIKNNA